MKLERLHKIVIFLVILLLVATSITYIFINNMIVIEKKRVFLYGTFYDWGIDEENDTISFTVLLSSPEKTKDWTIKFITPEGKYTELNYEYIDSQNDGFLNSGDKIVIYNRSEYINYVVSLFVYGYAGNIWATIV